MNKFERVTRPLLWFTALLFATLTAGCGGGGGGGAILGAPGLVSLVSLAVTPAAPIIPITGTQQFTSIATFSDGSTRNVTATSTWSSATPAVATIVPATGLATGLTAGTSVITASYTASGVVKTATATLTVNAATSVSFKVTPTTATIGVSGTQQYTAIQTFSDGSIIDRTVTSVAGTTVWTTSGGSAANATIGAATGLATGVLQTPAGTPVIVNARFTPAGGVAFLDATAATLIVNAATSTKFEVLPIAASISAGGTQQFAAIETYSDGTTYNRTNLSAWTSATPGVATVCSGVVTPTCLVTDFGLATGVAAGTSNITASYLGYSAAVGLAARTALLTVTNAPVVSISVTPAAATIAVGGTQQYVATATHSDGTSSDVTANGGTVWTSATPAVATITSPGGGLATGVINGTSNITATFSGKTSPVAVLTVSSPVYGPAGAPPTLGTVTPYGLLALDAITNSAGPSHIYGDVALTAPAGTIAAVTGVGFNDVAGVPLKSTGVTNSTGVTPGVINAANNGPLTAPQLALVLADLQAVYNNLMGRPVVGPALPAVQVTSPASGGTFAPGQDLTGWILGPGVYTTTGAYGLSNTKGALVLDAGGNADAVFVIRSTSAASGFTSTTGSVVLQGKAQAKNIFWVMNSAATIGGSTFFQGTLVAGNAITLLGFANVQGRMLAGAAPLAVAGALTLTSTNIITVPQ